MVQTRNFVLGSLVVAACCSVMRCAFCAEQPKATVTASSSLQGQPSASSVETSLKNALIDNAKLTAENQELSKKMADLESYAKTIMVLNTNLRNENDRLFQQVDKIKNVQQQMRQLEETVGGLQKKNGEQETLIKKHEATIEELSKENLEYETTLEGNELHQANLRYKKQMEDLEQKVGSNSAELAREVKDKEAFKRECAVSHYNLGYMLFKDREYAAATEEFKRSLALNPLNADAVYNLGIIYDDYLSDAKAAIMYYHQYLELASLKPEQSGAADSTTVNTVQKRMIQAEFREKSKVDSPIDQTIK